MAKNITYHAASQTCPLGYLLIDNTCFGCLSCYVCTLGHCQQTCPHISLIYHVTTSNQRKTLNAYMCREGIYIKIKYAIESERKLKQGQLAVRREDMIIHPFSH